MDGTQFVTEEERRLVLFLVDMRKKLKVTQQQLGDILGISAQQLSKVERGENRLTLGRFLIAMNFLKGIAAERPSTPAAISLGFAEAEQTIYGLPGDPRLELLETVRSMRGCLDQVEAALNRLLVKS